MGHDWGSIYREPGSRAVIGASQLVALHVPGVWIGLCVEGVDGWRHIELREFDDRNHFVRQFVASVGALVETPRADDVYDGVSNPRRTGR